MRTIAIVLTGAALLALQWTGTAAAARRAVHSHTARHAVCNRQTGDATTVPLKALNRLKNRESAPNDSDIDPSATLAALLQPGDDASRWDDQKGATLAGYVADVKVGGIETVNCHARDALHRDTHIDLTLSAADASNERRHVIVEVTPRWRAKMKAQGTDWSTATLRQTILGRCVKVTGWLLFDAEHKPQSANTAPDNSHDWRGTAWEVHPITSMDVRPSCGQ
jgi:hypothetical protein